MCFSLSRSDSAYVSRLADRLCEIFMMKCTFFFFPSEMTVSSHCQRSSNKSTHSRRSLIANYDGLIQELIPSHYSRAWVFSTSAPKHTHTHTCCYGNTHSHLDSFSCSAAWQKPSRWEWNNTLIRQEGHGAMWPTHTNTQIPLVQTPEKRTSD